ncbi:hypothetical protein GWI33_011633, partial [Rhynchophorus ferrugineus]
YGGYNTGKENQGSNGENKSQARLYEKRERTEYGGYKTGKENPGNKGENKSQTRLFEKRERTGTEKSERNLYTDENRRFL